MTSRERVAAAVDFTGPDRLPHRHECLPAVFQKYGAGMEALLARYPSDFAGQDGRRRAKLGRSHTKGEWEDEWGCTWTVLRDGLLGQVTQHPLADLETLRSYSPPRASDRSIEGELGLCRNSGDRYTALHVGGIWEQMIDLMSFQETMYHLGAGSPGLVQIRDMLADYVLELTLRLLPLDPDAIYFSDDWGSQDRMMVSPAIWREVFLPSYRRLFEPVRAAGKHVFFHTDGHTLPILPDLVEAGVSAFWCDLTVNGTQDLDHQLGGKVCFIGLTDVQFVLPYGTPEEVAAHTRGLAETFGKYNGGFIACSEAGPDQPLENIEAAYVGYFGGSAAS